VVVVFGSVVVVMMVMASDPSGQSTSSTARPTTSYRQFVAIVTANHVAGRCRY
jgi:hypothetical protein